MGMFGLDEAEEVKSAENEVPDQDDGNVLKPKRRVFAYWKVGKEEHKLKLKAKSIVRLEEKFRNNLLNVLTGAGMPPLGTMLTVIQGAGQEWNHKMDFKMVQSLYDAYTEEGGTQLTLYMDVIMPLLEVSGFFTENQSEDLKDKMEDVKESM